jgi:surface protein
MKNMFDNARMFNQPLDWDVSQVESMNDMFYGASSFDQDISNWNVSNVRAMSGMFAHATSFNQDLSKWNISKVELMEYTFKCATSLITYPRWKINKGVSIEGMYDGI